MRVKTIKFVLAMITMLSLLFVMGCKDTVTPSDPLVPQGPAGGGSTEIPPGEDDDNNQPETPYPGPQKPSAAIFHDETCTCGGTITLEDYSEGGIVVRCTGEHAFSFGEGNALWKAKVCYTMDASDEGPYVVSFEAKADSEHDSVVDVYNTQENLTLCPSIPISYTTEYKKYNYIVYINNNVLGENTFGFSINNGKTYIKNLTIENVWDEDAEWNKSELSSWKIWQDPSCNLLNVGPSHAGHISIYEMTKDSVKAIRNTWQMQVPEGWKHQVVYSLPDTSAGKYCMSFTNKSYSEFENGVIGNIIIQYWDEEKQCNISIPSATGITGQGKYYFYFDIPEKYNNKPFEAFFMAKNYGAWLEEYIILEDIKVEKVTEEVEIEGAKKLFSYKSETVDISDDWSIKYGDWIYGDVICSNVTESSIGITVPEEVFAVEFWPWVQVIRKPVTLNPGETYFVSADYVSNYEGFDGFSLWNSTDNIYVSTIPLDGGMCYTNTSNSSKQYFAYSHLEPGCIHIISNFKETILSPTPIWKDWSYLFVGKDDSFEALSVSNNGISFNIEDDFDLCAVDLALDLKAGECYRIDYTITGPNSEICTIIKGDNYISRNYDYIYENDPVNCSIYVSLSDMNYTGKCVLSFHPQVPGTYTISDIEVITVGSEGDIDDPVGSDDPGPSVPELTPDLEPQVYTVELDSTYTLTKNKYGFTGENESQVKIPTGLDSLKVGDKVILKMKGTASPAINSMEICLVDMTDAANWWTMLTTEVYKAGNVSDFDITYEFVVTTAPIGTGPESMMFVINEKGSDETIIVDCTDVE